MACNHKPPFSKRGYVNVIRVSLQSTLPDGFDNAPVRIASKHWRRALHDHEPLRAQVARGGSVKGGRIKFSERVIGGIGKIDNNKVEVFSVRVNPGKRVG